MDKLKKGRLLEIFIVILGSTGIVLAVVLGLGTLTAGFHMVDDHEFLEWTYGLQTGQYSLLELIRSVLSRDITLRYEPFYYMMRIIGTYLFGYNTVAFSIIKAIQIVISMVFLYACGKEMGASRFFSVLFSLTALMGYQSAAWWKLGPQESQCTMLFSVGFFFLLRYLKNKKIWQGVISLLFFIVMCQYKESFILLLPFIILYIVYDRIKVFDRLPEIKVIMKELKQDYWIIGVLAMVFIALVSVIMLISGGGDNYDGFGISSLSGCIENHIHSFSGDLKWYARFSPLFIAIMLTYWEEFKKLWKEIILLLAFLGPQFLVFSGTGIGERYMLPSTIGYAWFFIIVISKWKPLSGKRRIVYTAGLILMLAANIRAMAIEADYYRYRGESVTAMLEAVDEISDEETNILSCFFPNIEGNMTVHYWYDLHGKNNVYYWYEDDGVINQVFDPNMWIADNSVSEQQDFGKMDIVILYNQDDRHWCYDPSLDTSGFDITKCGSMTIWTKKEKIEKPQVKEIRDYFYAMER